MTSNNLQNKMSNVRWLICIMLFLATTVNYLDRQVLSLTWKDFIAPEFHWSDSDYGNVAAVFSIVYAIANIFSGRIIDWLGTKRGYLWAIGIWSAGACLHAICGWATQQVVGLENTASMVGAVGETASMVAMVSVYFFIAARIILACGEAGNFPSAVKVTAEYFPQKDRAFATSIFNAGSTVGALVAPLTIPIIARYFKNLGVGNGWEMAFIIIGGLGFIWMAFWVFIYDKPTLHKHVNAVDLAYIQQDEQDKQASSPASSDDNLPKFTVLQCLKLRQTWAILIGKFVTDGVWWFFLFWTPAYLSDVYGLASDNPTAQMLIFVLYGITMLSLYGGKLPTIIINRTGWNAYKSRMRAMMIFALFPLLGLFAQPLGNYSYWLPIILIGLVGAAHQSWSANLYSVGSDLFPHRAIATVTGLNSAAGGLSSFLINIGSGKLFDYADDVLGFPRQTSRLFHHLLLLLCGVHYWLDLHEGVGADV